ncbi:hypothetical protein J7E73_26235 [Paenibacillus albidus]|uniref:hypothetical protein n=1 Tax=Paenibacillus albidus TaxID=2041023 RepID=UPI001BE5735D|nr:hypothetical protein [Paenibacillus albidus]MBT2292571.1 hypothetical protein [Paenibacillus albidus]
MKEYIPYVYLGDIKNVEKTLNSFQLKNGLIEIEDIILALLCDHPKVANLLFNNLSSSNIAEVERKKLKKILDSPPPIQSLKKFNKQDFFSESIEKAIELSLIAKREEPVMRTEINAALNKNIKSIKNENPQKTIPLQTNCSRCGGRQVIKCPNCGASGLQVDFMFWTNTPCKSCFGKGEIPCKMCI